MDILQGFSMKGLYNSSQTKDRGICPYCNQERRLTNARKLPAHRVPDKKRYCRGCGATPSQITHTDPVYNSRLGTALTKAEQRV